MKNRFYNVVKIDPLVLDFGLVLKVVNVIRFGGIVIFPTAHLYALGGNAMRVDTIKCLFNVKCRNVNKPLPILIQGVDRLCEISKSVSNRMLLFMKKFWPGRVTFVVNAKNNVPRELIACTGKVGVRVPSGVVAMALLDEFGSHIISTSANISGGVCATCVQDIDSSILDVVDLIVDVGKLSGGESTVVDTTVSPFRVLREGLVRKKELTDVWVRCFEQCS